MDMMHKNFSTKGGDRAGEKIWLRASTREKKKLSFPPPLPPPPPLLSGSTTTIHLSPSGCRGGTAPTPRLTTRKHCSKHCSGTIDYHQPWTYTLGLYTLLHTRTKIGLKTIAGCLTHFAAKNYTRLFFKHMYMILMYTRVYL